MSIIGLASDVASFLYSQAANIAGYIGGLIAPPVAEPTLYEAPYSPPFLGGQCPSPATYDVLVRYSYQQFGTGATINRVFDSRTNSNIFAGKISGVDFVYNRSTNDTFSGIIRGANINGGAGFGFVSGITIVKGTTVSVQEITVTRRGGLPDNCGNLANPLNPTNINDSGLAKNGYPNLEDGETLIEGIAPLVLSPSLANSLAALAGATATGLAAALADTLGEIGKQLARKAITESPNPDGDNPDDTDGKPEKVRFTYGLLRRDGYLNLYPQDNNEWEGIYLDILVEEIPPAYGKYFGSKSPNYYEYRRLGHIVFVSPTFTCFGLTELRFRRNCIPIPSGAIGFAYHLGLDGAVSAVAIGYYNKYLPKNN